MSEITISDKRVINFYHDHPHININAVNLMLVELLECSQCVNNIGETTIMDTVNRSLSEISSSTKTILTNFETNLLAHSNANNMSYTTISKLFETNNQLLVQQIADTINRVVSSDNQTSDEITKSLDMFYKSITNDTQKLVDMSGTQSVKDYLSNLEMKTTLMLQNLQQPIYSFISASEDRINKNISAIKTTGTETPEMYSKLVTEIKNMIDPKRQVNNDTGDKYMVGMLTKVFNSADISVKQMGMDKNTLILKRMRRPTVFIQNYDTEYNVSSDETSQFMTLISEENVCGIFMSQQSGISNKTDFQIELHNNNVVVFIHNAEYASSKIEVAISIIDNLNNQLRQFVKSGSNDDFTVPRELLESINNEYQLFITQKAAVIDVFKESQKKVLAQIDEIRFPCLDRYLSTKYSAPIVKSGLKCDLCKSYTANNLKALAAHKRGCSRKFGLNTKRTVIATTMNDNRMNACITPISFDK